MSSYLFSFVAGEFKKTDQHIGDFNMVMLYRENDEQKIAASTDPIFKLHQESAAFLEDYTQYKYPFQKLDFATIPGFQYGGMEHTGAIQYRESTLFLDDKATLSQKLRRAKLIGHETAHMWYGNLVTMDWFDDVWLKEVFANFFADKIVNSVYLEVNHGLNFMNEHYASAYSEDRTKGATPIKQHLGNLKNAGTLYGRIIYNKAPIMMRQLEALVGEQAFRKGMRNYIKNFANANADWNDLVTLLDAESEVDVKAWSKVWVYKPSRPIISDTVVYKDGLIKQFEITQIAEDGSSNVWPQSFSIGLVYKDDIKVVPVKLNAEKQALDAAIGMPKPQSIIYNYDAFGYGVFPLKTEQAKNIPLIENEIARGYSYINLYENVLAGRILPNEAMGIFSSGLLNENEELILSSISGYVASIFWKYLTEEERQTQLKKLEPVLNEKLLDKSLPSSLKKTLFNLFKGVAYSNSGKHMLYDVWNKTLTIPNLNLNEDDYTSLGFTLALYNHEEATKILAETLKNITNPDRKKRAEFLLPSLSSDEKVRDTFMESLAKAENREKESWVIAALNNIHHPLRQQSGQKHLMICLELLEEIQLTGDIFFPKRWLVATIGSYTSENAYNTLEAFLNAHPNYSTVLKHKLLQASDHIYRAKQIREQH